MANESNERQGRIEANLDRITELIVQTAESQSVAEHRQSVVDQRIDKILTAVAADGENIRGLARIAEAHQRRTEGLEHGEA